MLVRLRAIGECGIDVGAARVGPDAEVAFALLLVLTLAGGHTVSRRRLTDLLWPCTPEDRARHNLRQTLYKLRQLGAPVESESLHVWLAAEAIAPNALLHGGADGGDDDDGAAIAAELLRADQGFGEFLAGYAPAFSAPFAAWLDEQRSVVHARLRRVALARLHGERRRGNWGAVERLARKVLQLDALNEEATLALAEATVMSGSKRAAIAQLDAYLRDLGADAGDIRLPATLLRRRIAERLPPSLTPPDGDACFVGRGESMAFLHDQLRLARSQGARTVLVWGDAGIGKSRLTTEFARLALMEGAQMARVGCQARDVERPLSIFVDVVPHLLALPGAIGCSPESMTYLRRLTAYDPTVVEPASEPRDAELLFAYVRRSILDLVDAVASESTLLLVFEDVHWLDEQSWRVLRELIGWLEQRRVLVLLTSRLPHATPTSPAREAAGVMRHRLGPLDREESLVLFDAATPGGRAPAEYREWCVQVADGNPLFVCACAHQAASGQTQLVPTSLTTFIEERVRALRAPAFQLALGVVILGSDADDSLVMRLLGTTRGELLTHLRELTDGRLVDADGRRLRPRHQAIADALLKCAAPGEIEILHRGAAAVFEASFRSTGDARSLWACAEHWISGGQRDRAANAIARYARHLLTIGAATAARSAFERGLALSDQTDTRTDLLDGVAFSSSLCGAWRRCLEAIQELDDLHPQGPTHHSHALLRMEARWRLAASPTELLAEAADILLDTSRSPQQRVACGVLALIFSDNLGDRDAARRAFDTCMSLRAHRPNADFMHAQRTAEMVFHASFGELEVAVRLALESIQRPPTRDAMHVFRDYCRASIPLRRAGHYAEADAAVLHVFGVAEDHRMIAPQCLAADILGTSALEQGRLDEASMWWQLAVARTADMDCSEATVSVQFLGARLALGRGDIDFAASLIGHGVSQILDDVSIRRRVEGLAVHLAVAVARCDRVTGDEIIPHLLKHHLSMRTFGGHDFAAHSLFSALNQFGRSLEAERLLADYVGRFRRESGPLPFYLIDAHHV